MFKYLFGNIGKKIKLVAKVCFWIELVASVLLGIILIAVGVEENWAFLVALGFMCFLLAPVVAWLSSLFLYSYGQMVDNSDKIANLCSLIARRGVTRAHRNDQPARGDSSNHLNRFDTRETYGAQPSQSVPFNHSPKVETPVDASEDTDDQPTYSTPFNDFSNFNDRDASEAFHCFNHEGTGNNENRPISDKVKYILMCVLAVLLLGAALVLLFVLLFQFLGL